MRANGVLAVTAAVLLASAGSATAGPNLVSNGNFSAGATGFSTGYTLTTMTPHLFQNAVHGIYAAVLSLVDTNTEASFNDFAIDDISFSGPGVPEPAAWALMLFGIGAAGAALRGRRSIALA